MRRLSRLHRLLVVCASLALLPPGAWTLCLGDHGHVALEPASAACADPCETQATAEPSAACSAADCDGCEDIPMLLGVALRQSTTRVDPPVPAPIMSPVSGLTAILFPSTPAASPAATDAPRASRSLMLVLRC